MAKQTKLKRETMAENECDEDIEAKMSQMFGDEPEENKIKENVRRSSRSRKKVRYSEDETIPDSSEFTNGKNSEKEAKKRRNPRSIGSYFMKGDIMWYVALKRGPPKRSEQGIKGFQQSALSNLPPNQNIIMELRVALDETCYKERNKKYETRCTSIATLPIGNEQGNDSSAGQYFNNGKKKTKNSKKSMSLGSLTGHEKLHEYFEEPQEIIKLLLEKSENNQIDHAFIQDQLRLHKRICQAEIFDADEKVLYYTGVKKLPDQNHNDENQLDYSDSEVVDIEQYSMNPYQHGQFTNGKESEKKAKKRGKPKSSGSYFMKGDVMWFVALNRDMKKCVPKQGIKGFQQSALSNLPPDQSIIMELRVALDETCYKEKKKKYETRCTSIATFQIENEQDSDNDSSAVEYSKNGKKICLEKERLKTKTKKFIKGSLTGHEKLHDHFEEPQEIIKFLLEKSENNQIDHAVIKDQLRLHKRIRQAGIFDADEKVLYYTGVKKLQDENQLDYSDSEVDEIEQYSTKPYQHGQFTELNNKLDLDVGVDLYEEPTLAIKKPTKPECPYNLNGISRDDVIDFFKEDEGLKEHWQKIMDQDKYKSEFKRHVVALTTRDVGPHSAIRQNTNIAFLRQKTEKDGENVDIILIRLAREIASQHPKIGQEENGTQDKYAEHVLIPEGCERYLIHKFNMTEADAKFWYKSHHVFQCDFCDLIYNDHDILDKHIFEAHQDQLNEPPEPQRVVENHDEYGTEEEDAIPDLD